MERGRRLAIGTVGIAVMLLTAGLVLRAAGDGRGGPQLSAHATASSLDALSGDLGPIEPGVGIGPGAGIHTFTVPPPFDPAVPPGLDPPPPTLPPAGLATIPLPDFSGGQTSRPGSTQAAGPAVFSEPGVWVVKVDGRSPILVSRGATSGVAAGGTWVAFVEGGHLRSVRRTDLGTKRDLASGIGGTAAQGLPVSGGKRGVAFVMDERVLLVDPAAPAAPVESHPAPGADAVAAEEDGQGRLAWADSQGLHVGAPEGGEPAEDVQRGLLVLGHGFVASLQGGQVTLRDGSRLGWGDVDRLQTGVGGLVAASNGRVHLRTRSGDDRVLLDRASTPVVTASQILYVSAGSSVASASLNGSGAVVVATASGGRAITNLDLLDDVTLVVTVE